jgi:hypothetical protein
MTSFGHKNWMTETEMKAAAAAMGLPTDRDTLRRVARANAILFNGLVKATALDYLYQVKSQFQQDKTYLVIQQKEGYYQCTCPDFTKHQLPCKHAIAVMAYNSLVDLAYREEVVEAYGLDGHYYRFVRMCPPSTNLPSLEVCDV